MEPKVGSLKTIYEIDKLLARLRKKKRRFQLLKFEIEVGTLSLTL